MATIIREALTADGMSLSLPCTGMAKVGIGISGTWAGTVTFFGSYDGVTFAPVGMTPFPSGTAVLSVTANGNWELVVGNLMAFKAVFKKTSGTPILAISAALDSSYQDAFLAASTRFQNHANAAGAANTLTVAAQANRAWRLKFLAVSVDTTPTWATNPVVKVTDGAGGTILFAMDIPAVAGTYLIPLPAPGSVRGEESGGIVGSVNTAMVVVVAAPGGAVNTNIDAQLSAA